MNWKRLFVIFVTLSLTSCNLNTPNSVLFHRMDFSDISLDLTNVSNSLPIKIAQLDSIDLSHISSQAEYIEFAGKLNNFIEIMNDELDLDVPLLKIESDSWEKFSKNLNKYSPVIGNYNAVVDSAVKFSHTHLSDDKKTFYILSMALIFEVGTIAFASFYSISYNTIGTFYFKSGLSRYAQNHPVLVSKILSWFHWTYRNILVNYASTIFAGILTYMTNEFPEIDFNKSLTETNKYLMNIKNKVTSNIIRAKQSWSNQ